MTIFRWRQRKYHKKINVIYYYRKYNFKPKCKRADIKLSLYLQKHNVQYNSAFPAMAKKLGTYFLR